MVNAPRRMDPNQCPCPPPVGTVSAVPSAAYPCQLATGISCAPIGPEGPSPALGVAEHGAGAGVNRLTHWHSERGYRRGGGG